MSAWEGPFKELYDEYKETSPHLISQTTPFDLLVKSREARLVEAKGEQGGYVSLPRGVLTEIFSYFPQSYLLETLAKVCVAWKAAVEDPLLWKRLQANTGL